MRKIISCSYEEAEAKIQPLLDEGYVIEEMMNENVFVSAKSGYGEQTSIRGNIIFYLVKQTFTKQKK